MRRAETQASNWNPHVERVIISHELRGTGDKDDPYRRILTVWTLDGERIAEGSDPQEGLLKGDEL